MHKTISNPNVADLFAGSLFITLSIPTLNIYLAVIVLLAVTVIYAIAGGLKAVIYVEALQSRVCRFLYYTLFKSVKGNVKGQV